MKNNLIYFNPKSDFANFLTNFNMTQQLITELPYIKNQSEFKNVLLQEYTLPKMDYIRITCIDEFDRLSVEFKINKTVNIGFTYNFNTCEMNYYSIKQINRLKDRKYKINESTFNKRFNQFEALSTNLYQVVCSK